jgi:membrane dipeptidase
MRFIDLHEDIAFSSHNVDIINVAQQSNIVSLRRLGDVLVFASIFPHVYTWDERVSEQSTNYKFPSQSSAPMLHLLLEQFKFYDYLSRSQGIQIVRRKADLQAGSLKFLISIEGTDALTDPNDAYILKDLGLRCMGLTWNYDTKFAASCMSKKDYGLTGYGEDLVDLCNRLGIIIDVAHASKRTIIDVCNSAKKPVICSHGNASAVMKHLRNLDDEEIEAICRTGGVIGLTAIPQTLSNDPNLEDFRRHAEYIGSNFGWDHVSLGTDFLGLSPGNVPVGFESVKKLAEMERILGDHAPAVAWQNALRVINEVLDE